MRVAVVDYGSGNLASASRALAAAADSRATRLAMVAGLLTLGWRKALDVTEQSDEAAREKAWADLGWWMHQARLTLDADVI